MKECFNLLEKDTTRTTLTGLFSAFETCWTKPQCRPTPPEVAVMVGNLKAGTEVLV